MKERFHSRLYVGPQTPSSFFWARPLKVGLPHGQGQGLGLGLDGYGLGQEERAPRLLRKVEPKYPLAARRRQVTGKALVKFLVDPEGRVRRLDVVESRPRGAIRPPWRPCPPGSSAPACCAVGT